MGCGAGSGIEVVKGELSGRCVEVGNMFGGCGVVADHDSKNDGCLGVGGVVGVALDETAEGVRW